MHFLSLTTNQPDNCPVVSNGQGQPRTATDTFTAIRCALSLTHMPSRMNDGRAGAT
jgi:hypothetical protein